MKAKELLSQVSKMIASGEIKPETEIIVSNYKRNEKGAYNICEDLYLCAIDYVYERPDCTETKLQLCVYDEPIY